MGVSSSTDVMPLDEGEFKKELVLDAVEPSEPQDMFGEVLDSEDIEAIIFEEDMKELVDARLDAIMTQENEPAPASDPDMEKEIQRRLGRILGQQDEKDEGGVPQTLETELDLGI